LDRGTSIVLSAMASWALLVAAAERCAGQGADEAERMSRWLHQWAFVIGDWDLVEKRYGFDGDLIQTNRGSAQFSEAMGGQRFEEMQTLLRDDGERSHALHVFVYDPRSGEVEIARTDSDHFGFWIIVGKPTQGGMELREKYPDPKSEITRRMTYSRVDRDHFSRRLEFSKDKGETFFTRSEWFYSRR